MPPPQPLTAPKQALIACRILWAALNTSVVLLAGIVLFIVNRGTAPHAKTSQVSPILFFGIAMVLTLTAFPLGIFIRGQVFKKNWVGNVVQPHAYLTGNLVAWALCEGAALFGLVTCLLTRQLWPNIVPPALALVMLLLLYPNGKAMFPPKETW